MRSWVLAAATLLMLSPLAGGIVGAQRADSSSIVRFKVYGERNYRFGLVSWIGRDSLILSDCDHCSPLAYARSEITGLEVYRGSTGVRNAVLGFLGGGVVGGLVTAAVISAQKCTDDLCGLRYIGVSYGMLAGAVVGLGVGIRLAKETWDPFP